MCVDWLDGSRHSRSSSPGVISGLYKGFYREFIGAISGYVGIVVAYSGVV